MKVRGLTWDHPRGYRALRTASVLDGGVDLRWDVQPLEGFESVPLPDLAARYDLLVIDHPHLGEAVAARCLRPLDTVFEAPFLDRLAAAAMGPAFRSYVYAGRPWALPLDAAAQVMAARPDRVPEPPATWDAVEALAARLPMGLCLAGPHAILHLLALAVALGDPHAAADPEVLLPEPTGREALARLRALHALRTPAGDGKNPIAVLDSMASGDDIAFCPLVFGYVPYARPSELPVAANDLAAPGPPPKARAPRPRALRFTDAPAMVGGGRPGSVLGGTGIAVSTRSVPSPALVDHLEWLMSDEAQTGFIPDEAGQPGLRVAWADPEVNRASGDFYAGTARTLEAAWVRPRHRGWIAFQTEASAILRDALADGTPNRTVLARLQNRYAASRAGGGEI